MLGVNIVCGIIATIAAHNNYIAKVSVKVRHLNIASC